MPACRTVGSATRHGSHVTSCCGPTICSLAVGSHAAGSLDTWFMAPQGETYRSKVAVRPGLLFGMTQGRCCRHTCLGRLPAPMLGCVASQEADRVQLGGMPAACAHAQQGGLRHAPASAGCSLPRMPLAGPAATASACLHPLCCRWRAGWVWTRVQRPSRVRRGGRSTPTAPAPCARPSRPSRRAGQVSSLD